MINKFSSLLFLLATVAAGCKDKKPVFDSFSGFAQGTTYSVVYENRKEIFISNRLINAYEFSICTTGSGSESSKNT